MAEEKILMYKGHPLMRKGNLLYYGSMADSHIVMLQILETKEVNGEPIASHPAAAYRPQREGPGPGGQEGRKGRTVHRTGFRQRLAGTGAGWQVKSFPEEANGFFGEFFAYFSNFQFFQLLPQAQKVRKGVRPLTHVPQ